MHCPKTFGQGCIYLLLRSILFHIISLSPFVSVFCALYTATHAYVCRSPKPSRRNELFRPIPRPPRSQKRTPTERPTPDPSEDGSSIQRRRRCWRPYSPTGGRLTTTFTPTSSPSYNWVRGCPSRCPSRSW